MWDNEKFDNLTWFACFTKSRDQCSSGCFTTCDLPPTERLTHCTHSAIGYRIGCFLIQQTLANRPGECHNFSNHSLNNLNHVPLLIDRNNQTHDNEQKYPIVNDCVNHCQVDNDCKNPLQICCKSNCHQQCTDPIYNELVPPRPILVNSVVSSTNENIVKLFWSAQYQNITSKMNPIVFILQARICICKVFNESYASKWQTLIMTHEFGVNLEAFEPGRLYQFRIAAVSIHGTRGFGLSTNTYPVDPIRPSPPGPPRNVTDSMWRLYSSGKINLLLRWQPPVRSDLPLTEYLISWSIDHGYLQTDGGTLEALVQFTQTINAPIYNELVPPRPILVNSVVSSTNENIVKLFWSVQYQNITSKMNPIVFILQARICICKVFNESYASKWQTLIMTHEFGVNLEAFEPGRLYQFRIAAVSIHGTRGFGLSTNTYPVDPIRPSPPGPPTNVTDSMWRLYSSGKINLLLRWQPPVRSDLPLTEYLISWSIDHGYLQTGGATLEALVQFTQTINAWVCSVDFQENSDADENIVVGVSENSSTQEKAVKTNLETLLNGQKVDGIFCVAGGWVGGNAAAHDFLENCDTMWKKCVWSSSIAASLASKFLLASGLSVLTGAHAALQATPSMLGYGMAKAAVHQLTKSLAGQNSGLPYGSCVLAISPATLDTPMNRKWMPKADHSSWTATEKVAELFTTWLEESNNRPQSGSIIQLVTKNGITECIPA
ncbi:unnamed protein product [Schistosoma turkestanicum]|nr:unnamed protein product [Schistosoma turkestanicum]